QLARKHRTSFVIIHHIKKPSDKFAPRKLTDPGIHVNEWLLQAAGPRAFVNQTDVRIAMDRGRDDADLVVNMHSKLQGEGGVQHIERIYDANGEPVGYRRRMGALLLSDEEQRDFALLPPTFTFSEAKKIYGKS